MKKMITKTAIVSAVAFALVALPVSARSRTTADTRDDNDNRPMMPMMMMQGGAMMGGAPMHDRDGDERNGLRGASIFGTVVSVSADNGLITLKDADGKERAVHVNPFTHISQMANGKTKELTILDVKAGAWIAVNKLNSDTTTAEAAHILVAAE